MPTGRPGLDSLNEFETGLHVGKDLPYLKPWHHAISLADPERLKDFELLTTGPN